MEEEMRRSVEPRNRRPRAGDRLENLPNYTWPRGRGYERDVVGFCFR